MINDKMFEKINIPENLSIDFWKSEGQIINYCQGILSYIRPNNIYNITVAFREGEASVTPYGNNVYHIILPTIKIANDDTVKLKNIVARTVFLRHELAHIIFTGKPTSSTIEEHKIYNGFEDIRIENLFSQHLKGTYKLFENLIDSVSNMMSHKEVFDKVDLNGFIVYCRLRQKHLAIREINDQVKAVYEEIYNKYYPIFHLDDYDRFCGYVKEIIELFQSLKQQKQNNQNQEPDQEPNESKDDNSDIGEKEKSDNSEKQESNETEKQISEEKSEEKSEEESSDSEENNGNESESGEQEDSEEDSNTNPDDSFDSEEDSEEAINEGSDEDELDFDSEESDEETSDEDEDQDDVEDKENSLEDILRDNINTDEQLTIESMDFKKLLLDVSNESDYFEMDEYQFDPKDFDGARVINFAKIAPQLKGFIRNDAKIRYQEVVNSHKKIIHETINFLKLKLKLRNKDKNLHNQNDGKLDQKSLKELFVDKEMPKVFFTTLKQIQTDSEFYLLIDFSGSMGITKKRNALTVAIILLEVCKALGIKSQIGFFAGVGKFAFKAKNESSANIIINTLVENGYARNEIYTQTRDTFVYVIPRVTNKSELLFNIKTVNEKPTHTAEQIIGSMLSSNQNINFITGTTPELDALISIVKNIKTRTKKNLFIINDGAINQLKDLNNTNIIDFTESYVYISGEYYRAAGKEGLITMIANKLKKYATQDHEFFSNPTKYVDNLFNQRFSYYSNNTLTLYIHDFLRSISVGISINSIDNKTIKVYNKCIEYAKENNFNIYGFGIQSDYGKLYLKENFESFRDSADIKNSFATKIRQIF